MADSDFTIIPNTENYYGSYVIKKYQGKLYGRMEDWDSNDDDDISEWEEIPAYLYNALKRYADSKTTKIE